MGWGTGAMGRQNSAVRHADCAGWDGPFFDCSITATELWLSSSRANEYYLIIVQFVLSHVLLHCPSPRTYERARALLLVYAMPCQAAFHSSLL